jgi:hypothetical protein
MTNYGDHPIRNFFLATICAGALFIALGFAFSGCSTIDRNPGTPSGHSCSNYGRAAVAEGPDC